MSSRRLWIAVVVAATLASLFIWQRQRHDLIAACGASGGIWNGLTSECRPPPGSPVIQRDLRRI
jgi:hypothetical protein